MSKKGVFKRTAKVEQRQTMQQMTIVAELVQRTNLRKQEVVGVLAELRALMVQELVGRGAPGVFPFPEMGFKAVMVTRPALPEREGVSFGKKVTLPAREESRVVKFRPMKKLKDELLGD